MGFVIVRGDLIYLYLSEQVNLFWSKLLEVLTSLNLKAFLRVFSPIGKF